MSKDIKAITVYAASSCKIDRRYLEAACNLGKLLAVHDITCIYGGGANGLMGAIADAMLKTGGKVRGIIPQFMVDNGWLNRKITDVVITFDMHSRKQLMAETGDACIAMPGGIGTMEELLEIITWRQLGLYNKPVVILNTRGFYDNLLAMLRKIEEEDFMNHDVKSLWSVAKTPEEALRQVLGHETTA
jgi:uncharacterized protein (TIGR00730 family)